jgi:hypothetical protein
MSLPAEKKSGNNGEQDAQYTSDYPAQYNNRRTYVQGAFQAMCRWKTPYQTGQADDNQ